MIPASMCARTLGWLFFLDICLERAARTSADGTRTHRTVLNAEVQTWRCHTDGYTQTSVQLSKEMTRGKSSVWICKSIPSSRVARAKNKHLSNSSTAQGQCWSQTSSSPRWKWASARVVEGMGKWAHSKTARGSVNWYKTTLEGGRQSVLSCKNVCVLQPCISMWRNLS